MIRADPLVLAPHLRCAVGEGPVVVGDVVYWVDILQPRVHRLDLATGVTRTVAMPEMIGFALPRRGRSDFVVGLASGLHVISFETGSIDRFPNAQPLAPAERFNDAKVDARGLLWAGTMLRDGSEPKGALNRIAADGRRIPMDGGYFCPNGPAFGASGAVYHADSPRRVVYRLTFDEEGGLVDKSEHVLFDRPDWGLPDGMTVDAEDCLWVAHWDGGRVSRFDPKGRLIESWALPVSRVTSCAFGGDRLDRMFVTSAAHGREHEPDAGRLFEIDPGVRGVASQLFLG